MPVTRKRFIPSGAVASVAPGLADAAEDVLLHWVLPAAAGAYRVRLRGAVLVCDWLTADAADTTASVPFPFAAPLLEIGPDRRPVLWRISRSTHQTQNSLVLVLNAIGDPCQARVVFAVHRRSALLSIATVLRHRGDQPDIAISASTTANIVLAAPDAEVLHLSGAWSQETQIQRSHRGSTPLRLESRAGKTGFDNQPYLAVPTPERTYLCQLLWSGNWQLSSDPTDGGMLISGGLHNAGFHHVLRSGATLALPTMVFGAIDGDLNTATQRLHDYRRGHRPNRDRAIPVQFNSWYPYQGEPNAAEMLAILPTVKRLGCEAFVVDAGWYRAEDDDGPGSWEARTGDWHVSRRRFPNGLREIGVACREQGLHFGLWIEPEVIGSLSEIRRLYPNWLHHIGGEKPKDAARAVLNLGLPAARQHVFDRISALVVNVGVRWLKWDFNTDLGVGGWALGLASSFTDQDPLVAHYTGLYRLLDAIRAAFPNLILEMCASGGGRMDGAILSHAHLNWLSDQPNAPRKLAIHFGSHLAHPAVACNDWLVEWPPHSVAGYGDEDGIIDQRGDLSFRLRVAMLGSFGVSARVDLWPEPDIATTIAHVALYKAKLRAIIHHGDQYLLTDAPQANGSGDWAVIWYATKDRSCGVLFAFRLDGAPDRIVALPGLAPDQRYRVTPFDGSPVEATGSSLADGLTVTVADHFLSALYLIGPLSS